MPPTKAHLLLALGSSVQLMLVWSGQRTYSSTVMSAYPVARVTVTDESPAFALSKATEDAARRAG